ncbi:MAG: ACT domain-containing protein [Actinomycetota bacterium]
MATDVTVYLPDQPGELARLGTALGERGVNIEGFCAVRRGGETEVHVLIEDPIPTMEALARAGIEIAADVEVAVIDVDEGDRPGVLGEVADRLSSAGVNISLAYLATETRLVFGSDDLAAVRAALV